MYKEELFKLAASIDLPKEEFCIISGGALVAHGLREQTNDLDIDITQKGLEILKKKFNIELINEEKKQYKVTDEIECFLVEKLESDIVYIDNYPCESLISVYKLQKRMNREKDMADILAIEKYLNIK